MKIGLNATCLNNRPSGARQRFLGLYNALIRMRKDDEFVVYEPSDCKIDTWFGDAPNVTIRPTPVPSDGRLKKAVRGLSFWGPALHREKFDVFEAFNLPLVRPPGVRTLLTIHDIRGVRPENRLLNRAVHRLVLGHALRGADLTLAVSQAVKDEILEYFPGTPISVLHNGLDPSELDRVTEAEMSAFRAKFSLPEQFVLSVGHFEERKNYPRLIEAMARLRDRGSPCPLVLIGNDSGLRPTVEERIRALKLRGSVTILSGLSNLELHCAYKLCTLFVFPSSYEGFGIPILEAMAAHRPMVLSDIPVFREITESSGLYFGFRDVEAMACALEKALSSTQERERLVAYGNKRVGAFSFDSLATQLVALHQNA